MKKDMIEAILNNDMYCEGLAVINLYTKFGSLFKCEVCNRKLKTLNGIKEHIRDLHPDEIEKEMERLKQSAEYELARNRNK